MWSATTDLVIFEIPVFFAFAGWAVVSYVITGQPFQQFTSVYGTTSQLNVSGKQGPHQLLHARILHDVHDIYYLAPTIPIIVALALFLSYKRRDVGVLAPLTVVGGGLAFDALAYISGSIAEWFRYFITAVPLEVLLVGCIFSTAPALVGAARKFKPQPSRARRSLGAVAAVVGVLVLVLPSSVTTVMGMGNPTVGFEETQHLGFIFLKHPSTYDQQAPATWPAMQSITDYLAGRQFSNGQIVVDNFSGCIPQIVTMSPNPRIFVIPNDRDFQRTLDDPLTFHAHYILDVDPSGDGSLTAINILYPALWKTGAGFSKQVHSWKAQGECPAFRLFRVTQHPNQSAGHA